MKGLSTRFNLSKAFWMGKTEVEVVSYERFVGDGQEETKDARSSQLGFKAEPKDGSHFPGSMGGRTSLLRVAGGRLPYRGGMGIRGARRNRQ